MSDNRNLELWNNVCITPPKYTKNFSQGFSGTAINSTYLIRLATEQWGMIGLGWGYDIIEERVDSGSTVYNKAGDIIGNVLTHTIKLSLWVKQGEEIARIEHFGHTPYVYYSQGKNYWITDQEAPKKSLTDAIKKCLSMFGFSADIFLGLYEDQEYVSEVRAQSEIDEADDKAAEIVKQNQEYKALYEKNLELIKTSVSINELEAIYKSILRKAKNKKDDAGIMELNKAVKARKTELEGDKK